MALSITEKKAIRDLHSKLSKSYAIMEKYRSAPALSPLENHSISASKS